MEERGISPRLFATALVTVVVLPVVLPSISLATEVLIYAMAALACNLLLGYTGLLSFGQAIFFGLGAYTTSLLLMRGDAALLSALIAALALSGLVAAVVGALAIRRTGIYFVMLTLAFTQMAYFAAYTFSDLTGGENGLLNVPRPPVTIAGVTLAEIDGAVAFYVFVGLIFVLCFFALQRVTTSPFGSTLLAIRENESRAIAAGYNTRDFKILAFIMSGAITGLAGGLYAVFLNFVPLENIGLQMSETILIMTILGGTGSLYGSILGALVLVVGGDVLSAIWPRWMMLLGFALIAIVLFFRGGLWGGLEALYHRWQEWRGTAAEERTS
jgi:branched-chain amino acid transport system permease protein